jgi:hypothetical protein
MANDYLYGPGGLFYGIFPGRRVMAVMILASAAVFGALIVYGSLHENTLRCRGVYWSRKADIRGVVVVTEFTAYSSQVTIQTEDSLFQHNCPGRSLGASVHIGDSIFKPAGSLHCTIKSRDTILTEWYYRPGRGECDTSDFL